MTSHFANLRFCLRKDEILFKFGNIFQRLVKPKYLRGGVVSLTFDDQLQTAYDHALPILEKYRFASTWFVCTNNVGKIDKNSKQPCVSWNEIRDLNRRGHEIGSHSLSHPNFNNLAQAELLKEARGSKLLIEDEVGCLVKSFAYPFTSCDWRNNTPHIISSIYKYCRGGDFGLNNWPFRFHSLFAVKLYERIGDFDYYKALIDLCIQEDKWIIFYTHDVGGDYTQFGCSELLFGKVLKYIDEKSIRVVPVKKIFSN